MELDGKVALVTGAARRVGKTIALALAESGADMALHYGRSADQAQATADEIRALGRQAKLFQADLAQPEQIEAMFSRIGEAFGRLDVLVNSAAVFGRTPLETLTAEQWDGQMAVNARAPALCLRHACGLMADGGAVVNITDIAASKAWAAYPAYCASKAALEALTRSAARALAGRNIRVNAVAPGAILWEDDVDPASRGDVLAQIPMKRTGQPQDIAAAVVFLARHDYITAQTLRVDGGWHTG